MFRLFHGETLSHEAEESVTSDATTVDGLPESPSPAKIGEWPFDYMFPELQCRPEKLLEESDDTVENLRRLGRSMGERNPGATPGAPVPTIYTFFGQFVDHDITLERVSERVDLSSSHIEPMRLDEVRSVIVNTRSPNLELDSVYGYGTEVPRDDVNREKLKIGRVSEPELLPVGKGVLNDLPRMPKSKDPRLDRTARVGDTRNDENLILSQLHVAFLHAHNALVDRGFHFEEARKLITQHYQWIVLDDFLEWVADPSIVKRVRYEGAKFFKPCGEFFMPLEFSVAAYRFGHSKVRAAYNDFNQIHREVDLSFLFLFSRFSGDLRGFDAIKGDWVIDWSAFLRTDDDRFLPRPIDTTLAKPLLELGRQRGVPIRDEQNLATRNLLRGYILRMPTGQAVAEAMCSQGIKPLDCSQIESVAANPEQLNVLKSSGFLTRTPLWFYILAEARYYSRGYHLGPVGSTLVAEVLIEVLRNSSHSILSDPGWLPSLGSTRQKFDLSDFLKVAGVLS